MKFGKINLPVLKTDNPYLNKALEFVKRPRVKKALMILGIVYLVFLLLDNIIMPLYTRHGQEIAIPDITLMSYDAAKKILQSDKFKVIKAGEKFDEQYPIGFVLFQSPEPGARVKKGRRIYLTVCKGKKLMEMPRLLGKSERDAIFLIESLDLKLDSIRYDYDSYYLAGTVSRQSIPAGQQVSIGSHVEITSSLGNLPSEFYVPSVVGKSLPDAIRDVQKAGLVVGTVTGQVADDLLPNTVISQSLPFGAQVTQGDTLNLIISMLSKKSESGQVW